MTDAKTRAIEAVLFDFGGVFTESPFLAAREAGFARPPGLGMPLDITVIVSGPA